jgi:hypothetical protein
LMRCTNRVNYSLEIRDRNQDVSVVVLFWLHLLKRDIWMD